MIAVVTDSTCDLPTEIAQQAGISIIPALVNIGQKTLQDGVDISRDDFYAAMPTMHEPPKTSAPAPGSFLTVYDQALSKADHIVSIHLASQLSGIYNAARLAAQQVAPDRIHLVDSGQVSMGLGWAVLAASDAVKSGATLEAVLNSVADTLSRVRLYALLNTLQYVAHSGRINMVQVGLGSLLDLKPMVEVRDGIVTSVARTRTWSRAVADLMERTAKLAPLENLAVMHSGYREGAEQFHQGLCTKIECPPAPMIVSATTVIGSHVGPHALGIAVVLRHKS